MLAIVNVFYDQFLPGVLQALASWGAFWLFVKYVRWRIAWAKRPRKLERKIIDGVLQWDSEIMRDAAGHATTTRVISKNGTATVERHTCVCSSPGGTRKECAASRNLKSPCRCACHRGLPFKSVDETWGVPYWIDSLRVALLREIGHSKPNLRVENIELVGALSEPDLQPLLVFTFRYKGREAIVSMLYAEVDQIIAAHGIQGVAHTLYRDCPAKAWKT